MTAPDVSAPDPWVIAGKVVIALVLVLLNGFFVAAEFALVKIRDTQLDPLVKQGNRRARKARHVLSNLDAYLGACQLGITLASLALGWVGEPVFAALLEPVFGWLQVSSPNVRHLLAAIIGFTVITFLHIVVGEQAPKFVAIKRPLPSSIWVAYPLHWFYRLTFPFIWVLNSASLWLLARLGIEASGGHGSDHSEDELRLMLGTSLTRDGGTQLGRDIVLNSLDLRQRRVRDIMRSRRDITSLDTRAPLAQCLRVAEESRFSRFPLCDAGNLERTFGVVHVKDLLALRQKPITGADLRAVARPLIFVPETARLERLLQLFLDRRLHMAFVVDEFGGTVGLVTLENILEEIVGQIQDEFDQERPRIEQTGPDQWLLDGSLPLFEVAELTGEPIDTSEVNTVSGWLTRERGGFPKLGDELTHGAFRLTVAELAQYHVTRVRLERVIPETPAGESAKD
jgi:CBS domain containing-hemolysin-like protein